VDLRARRQIAGWRRRAGLSPAGARPTRPPCSFRPFAASAAWSGIAAAQEAASPWRGSANVYNYIGSSGNQAPPMQLTAREWAERWAGIHAASTTRSLTVAAPMGLQ